MHRLIFAAVSALLLILASDSLGAETIPLGKAVADGKVSVQVNGTNRSTGDSIHVQVRRRVGKQLVVTVEPGVVLKSTSGKVQNMAVMGIKYQLVEGRYRKVTKMVLADDRPQTFVLEAYCMDFGKPTPSVRSGFTVTPPNPVAVKILTQARAQSVSVKVTQAAMWLELNKLSAADLKRGFPISDDELAAARALVVAVNEPNVDVNVQLKNLLARIRTAQDAQLAQVIRRGTKVVVIADADIKRRGKSAAQVEAGTTADVVRTFGPLAMVEVKVGDETVRGRISIGKLRVASDEPNTPLRDRVLEFFDKRTPNVRVEVEAGQ